MTVFCDSDIKCELEGDVVAKDSSDLRSAGVCMETKQYVYKWEDAMIILLYKGKTHFSAIESYILYENSM